MTNEEQQRYNNLQNNKARNEASQDQTRREIDAINRKIERLRAAYNKIDRAKEDCKSLRNQVKGMPGRYDSSWKGAHADSIYASCKSGGNLYDNYDSYIKKIDAIEDAINNEILRLKNIKADKNGFLSDLVKAWNYICTQIRNFFN